MTPAPPTPPSDRQLLHSHLAGNPSAFPSLLQRHLSMVHAAALRQSPAHADDITQAVFLLLHQKAATLTRHPSLAGWLFTTTRLCAAHLRRTESRRRNHEREAAMRIPSAHTPDPSTAESIAQHTALLSQLDEALASLRHADRQLILLRHLQNRPFEEIAAHLHIPIPTAARRTQRAIDRLRSWFTRRTANDGTNLALTTPALTSLLSAQAAHQAPAFLATATASTTATTLAHAISPLLTLLSLKTITAIAALLLLVASAGYVTVTVLQSPNSPPTPAAQTPAPIVAPTGEATLPGLTRIALFNFLVDTAAADELRKYLTPINTSSSLYAGYRASTEPLLEILREIQSGNRLNFPQAAGAGNDTINAGISFGELKPDGIFPVEYSSGYRIRGTGQTSFIPVLTSSNRVTGNRGAITPPGLNPPPTSRGTGRASFSRNLDTLQLLIDLPNARAAGHDGHIQFDGRLDPGESLLFLADVGQIQVGGIPIPGAPPYTHIALWHAFKATDDQMPTIRRMDDPTFWINRGPEGARDLADRTFIWQHRAPNTPIPDQFTRQLASGATVRLIALGSPTDYPFRWWRPDGAPSSGSWEGREVSLNVPHAVVIAFQPPPDPTRALSSFGPSFSYAQSLNQFGQGTRYYRPAQNAGQNPLQWQFSGDTLWTLPGDFEPLDVGISLGPWTDAGTMSGPGDFAKEDLHLAIRYGTTGVLKSTGIVAAVDAPPQTELRILAVDKAGKQLDSNAYPLIDWPGITLGLPRGTQTQTAYFPIPKEEIDHFTIQTRTRQWTQFKDYAREPSVPVPSKSDPAEVAAVRIQIQRDQQARTVAQMAAHEALLTHPDPSTPQGATAALLARARTGDIAGVRSLYAPKNPAQAASADALARMMVAHETLRLTAEKRFTAPAVRQNLITHGLTDYEEWLDSDWQIIGDTAFTLNIGPPMFRINGTWRIDMSDLEFDGPLAAGDADRFEQIKARLDRNEFPTLESLATALIRPQPTFTPAPQTTSQPATTPK